MSSSVESAASLFGTTEESTSDPFSSVIGADDSNNAVADVFGDTGAHKSGHPHDPYANGDAVQAGPAQGAYDPYSTSNANSYHSTSTTASNPGQYQSNQGWYDQAGQWQGYDQQGQANVTSTYGGYQSPSQNAYALPASKATDAYAPASYTPSATSAYAGGASSNYAPYAPGSTLAYQPASSGYGSSFVPPPPASIDVSSAYDPYKQSGYAPAATSGPQTGTYPAQSSYSSYGQPAYSTTSAPPSVPEPPKPTTPSASAFRPKTSNAYDPPVPKAKPKRPVAGGSGGSGFGPRVTSPPVGQQTYPPVQPFGAPSGMERAFSTGSPWGQESTQLPPPPPRSASAAAYHAAPPPPPPQGQSRQSLLPPPPPNVYTPGAGQYAPPPPSQAPYPPAEHRSHENPSDFFDSFKGTSTAPGIPEPQPYDHYASVNSIAEADPEGLEKDDIANQSWEVLKDDFGGEDPEFHATTDAMSSMQLGSLHNDVADPEDAHDQMAATSPVADTSADQHSIYGEGSLYAPVLPAVEERTKSPPTTATTSPPISQRTSLEVPQHQGPQHSPYTPATSAYDPYKPSGLARASSPSVQSWGAGPQRSSLDGPPRTSSPSVAGTSSYSPYAPSKRSTDIPRTASPATMSVRSVDSSTTRDPYAPKTGTYGTPVPPVPPSWGAPLPPPVGPANPYAPTHQPPRRGASEISDYGNTPTERYGYPVPPPLNTINPHGSGADLAPPTHAPYAPSPTLLGSNDPLGRVVGRAPVISFGFGGKLVTCFHGTGTLHTGFDVALSSRPSTDVRIRTASGLIPETSLAETAPVAYPGPLFNDPGTPTATSLVRTAASQTKTKKAQVLKYLEERGNELSQGLGYHQPDSLEGRELEGKLVLVQLLKVMIEHDGKLSGSSQAEADVRAILVPRLAGEIKEGKDEVLTVPAATAYGIFSPDSADSAEAPLATYTIKASSLDKITDFLVRGERKKAYHYALDQKLWAHAMVIASSIDKDAWKEVISEFVRGELGGGPEASTLAATGASSGREPLRVAYNFFAGQGAAAVQELVPPHLLLKSQLHVAPIPQITPISPNFPRPDITAKVPDTALSKWTETAAMLMSSPMTSDSSAALVALGDYLLSNQWAQAAHVCYLLSGQVSLIGGIRAPSVRIVLLGSPSPQNKADFYRDPDSIIFSEVLEFALSLVVPTKGQEVFSGLPHLQAYKLLRAWSLAEAGQVKLASRYCEAIAGSISRGSPYIHGFFGEQLKGLADRLLGTPQVGKGASWIPGKMSKPSLDGIGSWLEGRLTKFIAGEGESGEPSNDTDTFAPSKSSFAGPFSHYSSISSAAPSAAPSPPPTVTNPYSAVPNGVHPRSASAMAVRATSKTPVDRASSAMDIRHRASPGPRPAGIPSSSYTQVGPYSSSYGSYLGSGKQSTENSQSENGAALTESQNHGGWWGGASESMAPTPTASAFVNVETASSNSSGFISLMDNAPFSPAPFSPAPAMSEPAHSTRIEEDDEDLGFGNNTNRMKRQASESAANRATSSPSATETKPATASDSSADARPPATPSGSWLGRWWKRGESSPAPIKASLGEENSFYYDKELKRWVNKKAGAEAAKPTPPPPPPSRPQSAAASFTPPSVSSPSGPPPPPSRPSSAASDAMAPPKRGPTPRIRSGLIPSGIESAPTTPAPGATLSTPPPPMGRPKSQASKRNVRSRYVDVFQSENGGAS